MSRLMMGFQIIFTLMFFIGIGVEAHQLGRCTNMVMKLGEDFDSVVKHSEDEQLHWFCTNMTGIFGCINSVAKERTGLTIRELANENDDTLRQFYSNIEVVKLASNVEGLVYEICTPGSQLQEDYLANAKCFREVVPDKFTDCIDQSRGAYETFRNLDTEISGRLSMNDAFCVHIANVLGCVGVAVQEECGDKALETYKELVRKIGVLKTFRCSSEVLEAIKTSFIESLDESESRKSLYRVIVDLKRRRK